MLTKWSARSLQWVHIPVPFARDDEANFAPLADFHLHPEIEMLLGLIYLDDGVECARRRMEAASPHVPELGIATECGINRAHDTAEVEAILDVHAALARTCSGALFLTSGC